VIEELIGTYGLFVVFLGAVLEGETILVLAVLAAHRGYMTLPDVVVVAGAGALTGDQLAFHVGRWRGQALLATRPRLKARVARTQALVERHRSALLVLFRMVYGLRVAMPLFWGMSGLSPLRFLAFDLLGIGVWLFVMTVASWTLGAAAEALFADWARFEEWLFASVAAAGVLVWLYRRRRVSPV